MRDTNVKIYEENCKLIDSGLYKDISTCFSYKKSPTHTLKKNKFNVVVENCKSFDLLSNYENVCVLNFASATSPGGGYVRGATAQEEDLCRQSNLHESLIKHNDFYLFHKKNMDKPKYELHTDWMIYTKDVTVFRDSFYNIITPIQCSIITAAAPRFVKGKTSQQECVQCFKTRISKILKICQHHGHRNIFLGAWGCGVFGNSPNYVSSIFKEELEKGWDFDNVVFPVYDKGYPPDTYNTFKYTLKEVTT